VLVNLNRIFRISMVLANLSSLSAIILFMLGLRSLGIPFTIISFVMAFVTTVMYVKIYKMKVTPEEIR
jgi:hypothetical protein